MARVSAPMLCAVVTAFLPLAVVRLHMSTAAGRLRLASGRRSPHGVRWSSISPRDGQHSPAPAAADERKTAKKTEGIRRSLSVAQSSTETQNIFKESVAEKRPASHHHLQRGHHSVPFSEKTEPWAAGGRCREPPIWIRHGYDSVVDRG